MSYKEGRILRIKGSIFCLNKAEDRFEKAIEDLKKCKCHKIEDDILLEREEIKSQINRAKNTECKCLQNNKCDNCLNLESLQLCFYAISYIDQYSNCSYCNEYEEAIIELEDANRDWERVVDVYGV